MAHMNQEKKALIAAELKKIMPKDWRYSLAVDNRLAIRLTISSAPYDLLNMIESKREYQESWKIGIAAKGYYRTNDANPSSDFADKYILGIFNQIKAAMNIGNWDRSDLMTDYFDVGHYVYVWIGSDEKHFLFTPATQAEAA